MKRFLASVLILAVFLGFTGCDGVPGGVTVPTYPMHPTQGALATEPTETQTQETDGLPTETDGTEPETTEPAVCPGDEEFVLITQQIPSARIALAYAGEDNFTGCKIYDFTEAYLRRGTAMKLSRAAELLEGFGFGIVVWDAFRPVAAQQKLWDACPDPNFVSPPGTGIQAHCRGSAVDITLYDLATGEILEMPSGFDEFSAMGDRDYSDCDLEVRENALILETIMRNCGFLPYFAEWWHFSDTETYEIEYDFVPEVRFDVSETEPPATQPPETEAPATEPPATEPPATEPPATEPPVTEPPVTEPPVTEPPVTEPPATEPPATEPPATEPPATEPPATEPVATEPPVTEPEETVEGLDTVFGSQWVATCNQSMALRSYAATDAKSLATIYPGETMTLLSWKGKFAKVNYQGIEGYVLCQYIKPVNIELLEEKLTFVEPDDCYTYDEMMADLQEFYEAYPNDVVIRTIGNSEWGTEIPVIRIGSTEAEYHVLIQASIHGREYFTTWLVMAMADLWLSESLQEYGSVRLHIIPMMNPDGVYTAQTGTLNDEQLQIYHNDRKAGNTDLSVSEYAVMWKANGVGVDLNRNFDADWDSCKDRKGPSSMLYAGSKPFSAAEAEALRKYTCAWDFDATISYHSCGNLIFYDYGNNPRTNAASEAWARKIQQRNGYWLEGYTSTDSGGYKDWVIDSLGIPSLTIEVGNLQPIDYWREVYYLFARNCDVLEITANWLEE